jgi:hypothetical protein
VESYSKVLNPHHHILDSLRVDAASKFNVVERVLSRLDWELHQDAQKRAKEINEDPERGIVGVSSG